MTSPTISITTPTSCVVASGRTSPAALRPPVDLVALLERAFELLPDAVTAGSGKRGRWTGRRPLVETIFDSEAGRRARSPARRRERGGGRVRRVVRGSDADRPLSDEQRVRRLGHGAPHIHLGQRRRAGAATVAVAGALARCARRRRECLPRPIPERSRDAAAGSRGDRRP